MGLVAGGGYAEFAVVHETNALPVPAGMFLMEAGAVPETFFTVWTNVFERGGLKPGETLLVHGGTSGIGTTAIQLAKAFGVHGHRHGRHPDKCDACRKLGADLAINYRETDFVAAVKEATAGPRGRRHPRHGRRRLYSPKLRGRGTGRTHRPDRLPGRHQGRDRLPPPHAEAPDPHGLDPAFALGGREGCHRADSRSQGAAASRPGPLPPRHGFALRARRGPGRPMPGWTEEPISARSCSPRRASCRAHSSPGPVGLHRSSAFPIFGLFPSHCETRCSGSDRAGARNSFVPRGAALRARDAF